MNARVLDWTAALLAFANGARMPSTADEVFADTCSPALRAAADFKYGLDLFSVIPDRVRRRCPE
jgi:hypothetical protein